MAWLIGLLLVGFLVYAGGKETKFGGLGLLWRSAVVLAGCTILLVGGVLIYGYYQNREDKKEQITEPMQSKKINTYIESVIEEEKEDTLETATQRQRRLKLPVPFETVLSFSFPATTTQKVFWPDGTEGGTNGWEMRVAELPKITPSTRETGFFLNIERDVVSLNHGEIKLICGNTNPKYQKTLSGCRPIKWSDKNLGHMSDGMPYESQDDWEGGIFEIGTKVEMYQILPCTDQLLKEKEPCAL